jgi:hypothetical protein
MKKKPVRKASKSKVTPRKTSTKQLNRGALGAGMAYAILAMLVVLGAGTAMIGNVVPGGRSGTGQPVVIMTKAPEDPKNNLQLETFPGVTYTPTPTPTATPTQTPPPPPPASNGGSGGGHSAPDHGGGGGGGGAGVGYNPVQEIGKYVLALTGFSK